MRQKQQIFKRLRFGEATATSDMQCEDDGPTRFEETGNNEMFDRVPKKDWRLSEAEGASGGGIALNHGLTANQTQILPGIPGISCQGIKLPVLTSTPKDSKTPLYA